MQKWAKFYIAALLVLGSVASAVAVEVPQAEWERMKQRMAELESRGAAMPATSSMVDTAMDSKYGPCATVTSKVGKVQIGGLLQAWYYAINQSRDGFFQDPTVNGIPDDASTQNRNGFRVRRAEIRLSVDINENISAFLMIDP